MRMTKLVLTAVAAATVAGALSGPAFADWKPQYGDASPATQSWYGGLTMTPEAQKRLGLGYKSCCNNGDTVRALFHHDAANGQWSYLEDGSSQWKPVPPDIILWGEVAPDQEAKLFKNGNGQEICFVPPGGSI